MLALVVALTLGQCTRDAECKGDRVCASGECVDPTPRRDARLEAADRRVQYEGLTRELDELRAQQASSPFAPLGVMAAGVLFGLLSLLSAYAFVTSRDEVFAYLFWPAAIGGLIMLIGGGVRLGMNLRQRSGLLYDIADREAQLRELGAEPDGQLRPKTKTERVVEQLARSTGCPAANIFREPLSGGMATFVVCQVTYVCADRATGVECLLAGVPADADGGR